jgi:hypothetical protein
MTIWQRSNLANACLKGHLNHVLGHSRRSSHAACRFYRFGRFSGDERPCALRLRILDWEMGEPVYHVRLLSKTGGSTRSSIGAGVATEPFDNPNFDTLIVGGSAAIASLTRV